MEHGTQERPLKVCPHCSVASRTTAPECPNCGRRYGRGGWRWWYVIPIIAVAFAIGFLGRKALTDDDDPGTITRAQGEEIERGSSPDEVEALLGEPPRFTQSRGRGQAELDCSYYAIEGEPDVAWEFCFNEGNLLASQPVELE